jgi:hypothetical protein
MEYSGWHKQLRLSEPTSGGLPLNNASHDRPNALQRCLRHLTALSFESEDADRLWLVTHDDRILCEASLTGGHGNVQNESPVATGNRRNQVQSIGKIVELIA